MANLSSLAAGTAALLLVLAGPALAGRPLQTESTGVLERGACELETTFDRVRVGGVSARDTGIATACGIGWNSELGVSLSRQSAAGERLRSAGLGGKLALLGDAPEDGPALMLVWGIGLERDGRWRHSDNELRLVGSLAAGDGFVHANLAHVREMTPGRRLTLWGLAYEHKGFDVGGMNVAPMAEVFGDDRESAWWNLALRVTLVPDRAHLGLSSGRQTGDGKARLTTVSFKLEF